MAENLNTGMQSADEVAMQEGLLDEQMNQVKLSEKEGCPETMTHPYTDPKEDQNQQMQMEFEPRVLDYGRDVLDSSESSSINDSDMVDRSGEATSLNNLNVEETPQPPLIVLPPPGTRVHVIRSTRFMDDIDKVIKMYRTRGLQRGALVMFLYTKFESGESCRDVESDNDMLGDLFRQIGFPLVLPYIDKTKQETLDIIKGLKLEGFESVFVVVSSHGSGTAGRWHTDIRCSNGGYISSHLVVDLFNFPALRGIPKVFIFQACRGDKLQPELRGVSTDISNFVDNTEARGDARRPDPDRVYSDILIAHSTLPGFVSPRNENGRGGSWYKQALCAVFAAYAHTHHVIDLFRLLDRALQQLCPGVTTDVHNWGFNNDLYLHPGLAEDADGNPTVNVASSQ